METYVQNLWNKLTIVQYHLLHTAVYWSFWHFFLIAEREERLLYHVHVVTSRYYLST